MAMSAQTAAKLDSNILHSVIEHVFMPPKLPHKHPGEEMEREINIALCNSLIEAAQDFPKILPSSESPSWMHMIKMMELVRCAASAPWKEDSLRRALSDMAIGDVFCMHIRAQNAALIVRRLDTTDFVQFEVFEVLPMISAVMKTKGKLLCSYPGPAVQIPADIFMDKCFLRELSSFLAQMDVDHLNAPTSNFADYPYHDSAHPGYIAELLVGILRGYGQPADVDRITKRIGDEVLLDYVVGLPANSPTESTDKRWRGKLLKQQDKSSQRQNGEIQPQNGPWRRSPLWLILRVSLQISLCASNFYKPFILFFHTHLLRICVRQDFPSELLYIMRVKIARRLSKLGPAIPYQIRRFVHDTAEATEALLSRRWTRFQDIGSNTPSSQLKSLDFAADSSISLDNSYNYLMKVLSSSTRGSTRSRFTPSSTFRLYQVQDFGEFAKGQLSKAITEDQHTAIADFEVSVERNLESWVAASTNTNDTLDVIASCILQYFSGAKDLYRDNAEDNSIMILTIMDLWVALDRLAIRECPLLKEYSPEIPSNFLHSLLLRRSSALKRALHIEDHLCQRHREALRVPSVFSNSVDNSCFAVKYYHASEHLQRMFDEINAHAERERVKKLAEFTSLKQKSTSGLHWRSTMGSSHIHVYEWPLPTSMDHAQRIVFELSPPRAFSAWRDITYMILYDIGLPSYGPSASYSDYLPKYSLNSFSNLQQWAAPHLRYQRVTIGSAIPLACPLIDMKSADESLLFVDNQRSFKLFDHVHNLWVMELFSDSNPSKFSIPPIPKLNPYSHLHDFVSGTEHKPNDIITAQAECPIEIDQHEFIAFAGLRSGPRLQWLNIARELASPFLLFSREEVHTLITQAAWQIGPLSDGVREWHADLTVLSFGNALLSEMECLLAKIKANWLEEVTVRTIALISSRLLASTTEREISRRAYALLREARDVTYRWISQVKNKLDSTQDETSRAGLRHQLCKLAATCFSTFDVCSEHVAGVLFSEMDFSIAVECAVLVHENTAQSLSDDDTIYLTRLLRRHRRLLYSLEPIFGRTTSHISSGAGLTHASAYDEALARLWPGYYLGKSSGWHALPRPNSRWISCVIDEGQAVYYDLLTGELIMGGMRLERLPQRIVEHPTYARVFGTKILDVSPVDILGMDYIAQSTESGYQILLSWNNGDLVLQARNPRDSQILQLIPQSAILGDFPRYFIDEYIHWLDLSTDLVLKKGGKPGIRSHTLLQRPSRDASSVRVIDIRSNTFAVVSSLLSPIEDPQHFIIMHTAHSLEISLPRLRLSFFLNNNWELECRSMPGYIIDKTQSCGTTFGLRNKLILCPSPTSPEGLLLPRRVIIPQGDISFRRDGAFTNVTVNIGAGKQVLWHEYTVDTDLGCLTSNTTLMSKLYQSYLHALTSHCLPDPLLGQTGTEEALCILRSATCQSFQRLGVQEAILLESISKLSPNRSFAFPSIASVVWGDLPALSQHDDFCRVSSSILDHAHALEALYHPPNVFTTSDRDQSLLKRAACRNRIYYPSDLHILEHESSLDDPKYMSRDVYSGHGSAEHLAYQTSWSMWNERPLFDARRLPILWNHMTSGDWDSHVRVNSNTSLRYSRYWLQFEAARDWFAIYDLCQKSVKRNRRDLKIELSFSFSAAAYSRLNADFPNRDAINFLTTFVLDEHFRNLSPPPPDPSYKRHHGIKKFLQPMSRNSSPGLRAPVPQFHEIQQRYENVTVSLPGAIPYHFSPQFTTAHSRAPSYSLRDVLTSRTNVLIPSADRELYHGHAIPSVESTESALPQPGSGSLKILIEEFQDSRQHVLQHYGDELNRSHRELLQRPTFRFAEGAVPSYKDLSLYHEDCSQMRGKVFSAISAALKPSQTVEEVICGAGLWPRITPRSLLSLLAQDRIGMISDMWKFVIMRYAISFLKYLQSLRLLELSLRQDHDEILLETEAIRHDVLAESAPDWLLVQIEARLVARPVQVSIAREMISPITKRSISIQLNMGEGKSSVIVPLVASTLANGSNLVRVVTLKPLSSQMFQLLVSRLSGLANRPIFYVPVSRSLRVDTSLIKTIRSLYERCTTVGGVLVVQPEHILSQKLKHIDVFIRSQRNSEEQLISDGLRELQDWLAKVSRDVLDESDEILHPRFQLIYSTGEQTPVNGHHNRWTTIQQTFSRLRAHAVELHNSFPDIFEVDSTLGGFPIMHIRDFAILQQISSLIIDDALDGRLPNPQVGVLSSSIRAAVRRFLSQTEVSDADHASIHSRWAKTTTFNGILLLRGLLMDGGGILGYVLKERQWNVDYGLDPSRTLLAVPYRAKGVPSLSAEFSHPDVAIALTCLSYYYGGLTKVQVLSCFNLLAKLNNPEMEYDHWVELAQDLPAELRQLNGINMDDEKQVDGFLVPLFSRNKGMVDFYLSQVVFPMAVREFESKLPTSAWDLVELKTNVTTGFSGTNDDHHLLPTSITQEDPAFVLGTNALVLQYLLRPENDHYECTEGRNGERENASAFLERLVKQDHEIRVLLDVGAQILELQNEELARYWLSLRPDVSAAVFFNDLDHLTVVTPDGITEPFISSPFNKQPGKCVFYIDDAHTRGTDLKLPRGMRAAVTLGPKVTKDRLVQGCMRMRQLGKGHSVKFFAPGVVDRSIRSLIPGETCATIRAIDIIRWAVHRTCEEIDHHLLHWAQQGLDHHKRFAAYKEYRSSRDPAVLREAWLQSESRTLEQMYWIESGAHIKQEINSVPSLRERVERLGVTKFIDGRMAEEQEREVNHEVETGKPTGISVEQSGSASSLMVEPAQHSIHADILEFIETGRVLRSSTHISPLLTPLNMVRSLASTTEWTPIPRATADFMTTILDSNGEGLTEYLRPVNWILSSGSGKNSIVIVISPYEANELLPLIRKSNRVRLHIYSPRVTLAMRSFSDLTFYTIPDSLTERWSAPAHVRTELNLFAGQLYLDSMEEYKNLCALLGLSMAHPKAEYSELDGFVPLKYRTGRSSPFERSMVPILKKLIGLRRKEKGYEMTHLGQILNGKPLSEETLRGL